MKLSGKTIIVTGAGSGIGRTLAFTFAAEGANVACAGRTIERLDETVRIIERTGGSAFAIQCDVTDVDAVDGLMTQTEKIFGKIDVLFNNAGSFDALGAIWEVDPETWWQDVEVNLRGVMLCCRAVLPAMQRAGGGVIINMSGGDRIPGGTAYSCSKVAVVRFTELLAAELKHEARPVTAFVMGPGFVRTPMTERQATTPEGRKWLPSSKEAFDQGRDRPAEDCARAAVELIGVARTELSGRSFSPDSDFALVI